jgi:hypothetical protein
MPELKLPTKPVENWEQVRDDWSRAVVELIGNVEKWCKARDWPTRRIEKRMEDRKLGEYRVPALLIQIDLVKLMLEPIARFVPGADGLVDLYLMPAYDDVASIYFRSGGWQIHYTVTGHAIPPESRQADPNLGAAQLIRPLTAEEFAKVVALMV